MDHADVWEIGITVVNIILIGPIATGVQSLRVYYHE